MEGQKNKVIQIFNKGYRISKKGLIYNPKGKNIKGYLNNRGYVEISFKSNSKALKIHAHRLQAYQKFGDRIFDLGIEVRHLDGNPLNNSFDNISIGTHSDNMNDIKECIRKNKAIYASSFIKKHNHNDIISFYEKTKSYKKTMDKFNITSKSTLHYIINKK